MELSCRQTFSVNREADRLANLSKVSVRQSGYSVYSMLSLASFLTFKQPSIQYPLQSFSEDRSFVKARD